jgi:hypothetical protein
MKSFLFAALLLGCALATMGAAPPAQPAPAAAAESTNQLFIVADGSAFYSRTNVVYWRHVRAAEADFYLECEKLTATFKTNSVRTNLTGSATATNSPETRIDRIIAETNVMIISRDSQIIGDYAVYYGSNDTLYVTGELVIAANAQGSILFPHPTAPRSRPPPPARSCCAPRTSSKPTTAAAWSIEFRSTSKPAKLSGSSGPTAPARPPPSTWWSGS